MKSPLLLTAISSMAVTLLLPMSASAQNHHSNEPRQGSHGERKQEHQERPQATAPAPAPTDSRENTRREANADNRRVTQPSHHDSKRSPAARQSAPATAQRYSSGNRSTSTQWNQNRSQASSRQPDRNRGNRYGGLWFSGDTHRDWNRGRSHYWNNHNYRWYDGGWLIIDAGFVPDYSASASVESAVQMRLSDLGYYQGPIDGDIGPGSHNAIARFQNDHRMEVTGQIDNSLLRALQLE